MENKLQIKKVENVTVLSTMSSGSYGTINYATGEVDGEFVGLVAKIFHKKNRCIGDKEFKVNF